MKNFIDMIKENRELIFKTCVLVLLYSINFLIFLFYIPIFENNINIIIYYTFISVIIGITLLNIFNFIKHFKCNNCSIKIIKKLLIFLIVITLIYFIGSYITQIRIINNEAFGYLFEFITVTLFISLMYGYIKPLYICYVKKIDQKYISETIYKTNLLFFIYPIYIWISILAVFLTH